MFYRYLGNFLSEITVLWAISSDRLRSVVSIYASTQPACSTLYFTCLIQKPDTLQAVRVGAAHGRAARRGRLERHSVDQAKIQPSLLPSRASVSSGARTQTKTVQSLEQNTTYCRIRPSLGTVQVLEFGVLR